MISFDLICGVTTDEMKDGEGTSGVRRKPVLRDADELAVEDEEMFTVEDASGNGLARDDGHGEEALSDNAETVPPSVVNSPLLSPLFLPFISFISQLSSLSFSYAWPCPIHL